MEYVYPAILHENDDETFTIMFPDLPGCISEGKTFANALFMAQSALTQWLRYMQEKHIEPPAPSGIGSVNAASGELVHFVRVNMKKNSQKITA